MLSKPHSVKAKRFQGVAKVYGAKAYEQFTQSHVCVIGLGGVGSWVVEALARSAIGELTLIDMDHVAESNINRQLQATDNTLGKAKAQALAERIATINPDCKVHQVDDFISAENQADLLDRGYDWVIDCIDSFRTKASLIHYCRRNKIKLLTMGGAGGMTDPSKIKITDLSKTKQDPLLAKVRKLLRQDYHFPENTSRRFGIPCVFSEEHLLYPTDEGGVSAEKPKGAVTTGLNCASGFGSAVCVTAPFGFYAAGYVLRKLAG
ncbi:MAG TPA: tRNA cyclic N6-threonylcarbamoyladenosine(37) synthase TcdA [Thiothrix sp.]|nr:tRNA cyclic N6-threonylcarbamoyladenosine(37) synthase TcdA [Thiothrix sp.]